MLKNSSILVVAAGDSQCHLIRKAKSLGLKVISTDRKPDSPGFSFSDRSEVVDIIDLDRTLAVARKYRVDAVLTDQTDVSVPTVAFVAEKLGLPGIGYEVALKATNKFMMRQACMKAGIPVPRFELVRDLEGARAAAADIRYPVVIKPVDNQGSRGVFTINNIHEISRLFPITRSFSRIGQVLVEQLISGSEATVEGCVVNGQPHVLGISEKTHIPPPYCISKSILYAPSFSATVLDQINELNAKAVEAIGIPFGLTHSEYIVSDQKVTLIEIAARGGGSRISSIVVPVLSQIDVTEMLIKQALGLDVHIEPRSVLKALLEFLVFPPGRITSIQGLEQLEHIPELIDFYFPHQPGDVLAPVTCDPERHGQFILAAPTRDRLLAISTLINQTLKVKIIC